MALNMGLVKFLDDYHVYIHFFSTDKLGNEEEDQVAVQCDLESIITFYCKSRNIKYKQVISIITTFSSQ